MLGRGGVWIDTLADIETLFEGIDMERISINQIGSSIPVFAMILSEAQRRGISVARLRGAQSLSVNSFDEALAIPTEASATLSVRTQQIILYETGVAKVLDPLGGSYCVEKLTHQLEVEAREILDHLNRLSPEKAFDYIDQEPDEAGYQRQRAIDQGERVLVGVNRFAMEEGEETLMHPAKLQEYDPGWRERQIARLEKVKRERDPRRAEAARQRLAEAYRGRVNLIEPMMEAVKAYLSIGEIARIRKEIFGPPDLKRVGGRYCGV